MAIAILDFLPMFGTGTVLIPWAAVKLFTGDFAYAAGLGLLYVLSQAVRQIIQPKIVGDSMGASASDHPVFPVPGIQAPGTGWYDPGRSGGTDLY